LPDSDVYIHPTAIVEKGCQLGVNVSIGPYSIIGPQVVLEDHVQVHSHATVYGKTRLGANSKVWPFATLGSDPQDLKFKGENTELVCGKNNSFREYCNISKGTDHGGGKTNIGSDNLFMVNTHVAHDCLIGNYNIFANGVSLAGHIEVDDKVILGGHSACHQFIKIGSYAMLAGGSMVSQDVPPFIIVHGNHAKPLGINIIGLKRNNFSKKIIAEIKLIFKHLYQSNHTLLEAVEKIKKLSMNHYATELLVNFVGRSTRGICR
jgi:UDP-N-acetylglucosamine acyltransferase